jgi:fructuronate reductase
VAIVTITVTETAYLRGTDGHLDAGLDVVVSDLEALRSDPRNPVASLPARLVEGLIARRATGAAALSILSCDNLPENGAVTKTVVQDFAALLDESLPGWIDSQVDFATSMVDRITPGTTDEDRALVQQACGYLDAYPVATEPFSEWVVSGGFPAGRPRWEEAGVALVADVEPFEQRKHWLLSIRCWRTPAAFGDIQRSMKLSPIRPAGPGWRCSGMRQADISPCRPRTSPRTGKPCWPASRTLGLAISWLG